MNSSNAFGFVLVGAVMVMFPMLTPENFPPTGFDGTSARAIWLEVMGAMQMAIGVASLLQIWVHRLAAFKLPLLDRTPAAPARVPANRMAFE